MANKKKAAIAVSYLAVLILLSVAAFITQSFAVRAIVHVLWKISYTPLFIYILRRCFREQITKSMKKALGLCAAAYILEVALDAVRFVLRGGVSTVLFLPACLPLGFMVIMYYSFIDTGKDESEKKMIFGIGIPLLLVSLYFEILAFL